jgi:hypothetical protein
MPFVSQSVSQSISSLYESHKVQETYHKRDRERERVESIKPGTGMCDVMT